MNRGPRGPEGHRRPGLPAVVAVAGWCAFTGYLIAQATAGPLLIWNDSKAYAAVASRSLASVAFWAGNRPPLTPLVVKVVGSSTGYEVAQAVAGALAWGFLAWTVGQQVPSGWRRTGAIWVVLAFASALPVALWNRSLLSESMALSLLALLFAAVIWTARAVTWPRVAAVAVVALLFALSRDAQIWTVALVGVATAFYAAARSRQSKALALRLGVLALCLLAVSALTEWGVLSSHRTTPDVGDVLIVRVFPYPGRVAWFSAHGMPEKNQIDALARSTPASSGTAKVVAVPADGRAFAPLRRWMQESGPDTYVLWLATHPWYVVSEPLVRPERSYNFAQGDLLFYAATADPMGSPLSSIMWPTLVGLLATVVLALALGGLSGAWRTRTWRVVLFLSALGVVAVLVAWNGDGQEVTRHTVEGLAELRLGLWILIVFGIFGLSATAPPKHRRAPW